MSNTILVRPQYTPMKSFYGDTMYSYEAPFEAEVLVFVPAQTDRCAYYICKGLCPQTSMTQWVQDACTAAGVNPEQTIRLVPEGDVVMDSHRLEDLPKMSLATD